MFDSKAVVSMVSAAGLATCAVVLVCRGDVQHALTFAALLVPSIGQFVTPAVKTVAVDGPTKVTTEAS